MNQHSGPGDDCPTNRESAGGVPSSLARYGPQLERAAARDLSQSRRSHRLLTGTAVAAAAAVSIFAAFAVLAHPGQGPATIASASALEKAAAALNPSNDAILHGRVVFTESGSGGAGRDFSDESWSLASAPSAGRDILQLPGGHTLESGSLYRRDALYDPATNTIYVSRQPAAVVATAAPSPSPSPAVPSSSPSATATPSSSFEGFEGYRQLVISELQSGEARITGHVIVNGRDALKIIGSAGETFLVDAQSYEPIEWILKSSTGVATYRFVIWEQLPLTPANRQLLDLRAQHPGAQVDVSQQAYGDATVRLLPKASGSPY